MAGAAARAKEGQESDFWFLNSEPSSVLVARRASVSLQRDVSSK